QDLLDFIRETTGIQRAAEDPGNPIPSSLNKIPGDVTSLAPGATITQDGRICFVSNNGADNAVTIGLSGFLLTTPDGGVAAPNLGFGSSQKAVGQSAAADFLVYDSLGSSVNVRVTAVMESRNGIVRGAFSNGVSRTLGQIRLAKFANPAGLEQRGNNLFAVGANSALAVEGNPGENGIATLVSGAVELSNTDIGANLIDLVLATTQYRGNTRVITAAQQLLDELLNLRR
ncbi:MAG: flagellar hook-basal body complex protein, partial [Planctomycetota bacterium]